MDELISRQAAVELADAMWWSTHDKNIHELWSKLKDLPSVQPERKKRKRKRGKWIEAKPMSGRIGKVCSACGNEAYWDTDYGQQLFEYCPYCGSDNGEKSDNGRLD